MMRPSRKSFIVTALALAGALVPGALGCKPKVSARTRVAVSIFPIYDLVRQVAGPDADVSLLLAPGRSEHTFDPTPKEIEEVAASKLGILVGLGLDPWMDRLMKDAAPSARVLKVGERVPTRTVLEEPVGDEAAHRTVPEDDHDHDKGALDPHVWMDPSRARLMVKAIGDELGRVDAAHANDYRKRATALDAKLEALDKDIEARTATWKTRGFITFHGSFGYFAERYKLNIVAVIEPFPGATPTGEYLEEVLKVVAQKKVPAIFSEPQLDPRPAKTIATAAHIPLGTLDPVGGSADVDSYEKLLRYDVDALEKFMK